MVKHMGGGWASSTYHEEANILDAEPATISPTGVVKNIIRKWTAKGLRKYSTIMRSKFHHF